jgi:hypothetical protein
LGEGLEWLLSLRFYNELYLSLLGDDAGLALAFGDEGGLMCVFAAGVAVDLDWIGLDCLGLDWVGAVGSAGGMDCLLACSLAGPGDGKGDGLKRTRDDGLDATAQHIAAHHSTLYRSTYRRGGGLGREWIYRPAQSSQRYAATG